MGGKEFSLQLACACIAQVELAVAQYIGPEKQSLNCLSFEEKGVSEDHPPPARRDNRRLVEKQTVVYLGRG
jgi:hypothetical protein